MQVITFCLIMFISQALLLAMLGYLSLYTKVNHVLPCFSIMWKSNSCFLRSFIDLNFSLKGITTELGEFISFLFKVMLISFQSISRTSQIQFLLNLTSSMVSIPIILNRWILPAILHNFIGTHDLVFEIKIITFSC